MKRLTRMLVVGMVVAAAAVAVRPMVSPDAVVLAAPPTISNITPAVGPTGGGTKVVITGTNFKPGTTVTFDGNAALSVVVKNANTIEVVTPQAPTVLFFILIPGPVDVTVDTPVDPPVTRVDGFTYRLGTNVPGPVVTNVTPTFGPVAGGTNVVIAGRNFRPNSRVFLGTLLPLNIQEATNVTVLNANTIQATTPPGGAPGPVIAFVISPATFPNDAALQAFFDLLSFLGILDPLAQAIIAALNNGLAVVPNAFTYTP